MNKFILLFLTITFLNACGSKPDNDVQKKEVSPTPGYETLTPSVSNEETQAQKTTASQAAEASRQTYNDGYKFGYDMGYIAGQEGQDYNGSLPVGPNTRSYSYDYRCGYAAGYSAGYDEAQKSSHSGPYADETEYYDDDEEEYDEEEYDDF